jgi:hypothetical protein
VTLLGADDLVVCPVDDLEFRPYYTDGECPICGWKPADPVSLPWWKSADPVLVSFGGMLVAAAIMVIVVVLAYQA